MAAKVSSYAKCKNIPTSRRKQLKIFIFKSKNINHLDTKVEKKMNAKVFTLGRALQTTRVVKDSSQTGLSFRNGAPPRRGRLG
jgi:hypothetical protein